MNTRTNAFGVVVTRFEPKPKPISERARWAYGFLAAMSPISLSITLALVAAHAAYGEIGTLPALAILVGMYQVMGTAMLVMFFGRDMLSQRGLSTTERALWSVGFLFAAPVTLPAYWLAYLRPDPGVRRARRIERGTSEVVVRSLPSLSAA